MFFKLIFPAKTGFQLFTCDNYCVSIRTQLQHGCKILLPSLSKVRDRLIETINN